jgi:poly-gamma-glutamate capsule biosynthesis protein CapA/YwtB (metallophosphatase superfamily)
MVTLWLAGDVMMGRGIDQVMHTSVDPRLYEAVMSSAEDYVGLAVDAHGAIPRPAEPAYVWGDALADLDALAPDVRIVNLETAITTIDEPWPDKEVLYRAHPANVAVLSAARIDCCSLANNHALDWGRPGLLETLETMHASGVATVGAGRTSSEADAPALLDYLGRRVIVVAFGSTTSGIPAAWAAASDRPGVRLFEDWSPGIADALAAQVHPIRRPGDVVVCSVHWGSNWGHQIPAQQRELAHRLVDVAGIDIVHGHSSHHPRAVEVYHGRPILYGCGDFITDYEGISGHEAFRSDLVGAWVVTLDPDADASTRVRVLPYRLRRFRLARASATDVAWLAATLDRHSQQLGTHVEPAADGTLAVRA